MDDFLWWIWQFHEGRAVAGDKLLVSCSLGGDHRSFNILDCVRDGLETRACLVLRSLLNESVIADVQAVGLCLSFEVFFFFCKFLFLAITAKQYNNTKKHYLQSGRYLHYYNKNKY